MSHKPFDLPPYADWQPICEESPQVAKSRVEPIRFPHIPTQNRAVPNDNQYFLATGHLMRKDESHASPSPLVSRNEVADANKSSEEIAEEQVSQIADYLRRKRDELEAENAELAINTWQQQQALLMQRESLRQNNAALRRLTALHEKMRCELIELGHCLVENFKTDEILVVQFTGLCETYAEIVSQTKLVKAA